MGIEDIISEVEQIDEKYGKIVREAFKRKDVKELLKEYKKFKRIRDVIIESIGYFSIHNKLKNIIYAFEISKNRLKDIYLINEDYAVSIAYKISNIAITSKKEEIKYKVKKWLE